jgi:diguanylate cyclase (GGDEF)-like protein
MKKSGDDFYAESRADIPQIVHKNDRDLVLDFLDPDHMTSALEDRKRTSIDYRIMAGDVAHHVRMTVRKTSDNSHFIIGIENIDAEISRERQHLKALNTEKELARRDELTGIRNKTAYTEMEKSVQESIDSGADQPAFALVVCDANNLKQINDSEGHVAGDEYIKGSAMLLCDVFDHSPVFRVGGDEFVVFLCDSDYLSRDELLKNLRAQVRENLRSGSGPVLASGMSEFIPGTDRSMSEVFNRADREMYEDKRRLKGE